MISLTRASGRALAVAALAALALAGCGSSDDPTATATTPSPTIAVPSPTVTFTDGPAEDATDGPTDEPTDEPTVEATGEGPSSPDAQVVKVKKFGISFELPNGWITLDAKKALEGGGTNAFLQEMANRLGVSQQQLVRSFSTVVQTLSVSDEGAENGFLTNVNSIGQEGDVNDEQLKLQLATVGAKPGHLDHATTEAGDVTRIPYDLSSKAGSTMRGVALAVHTDTATVLITVSSGSALESARFADQIQASLKRLPGGAPGV